MLYLMIVSVLLLAVAIFALGNAQPVTLHFLYWQLQSSVAVVTLAATAAGVLIAGLIGLTSRLRRWKHGRAATGAARLATLPSAPREPARPSSAGGIDGAHATRSGGPGSTRSVDSRSGPRFP
jgi:uncharacterized integral membrane protein